MFILITVEINIPHRNQGSVRCTSLLLTIFDSLGLADSIFSLLSKLFQNEKTFFCLSYKEQLLRAKYCSRFWVYIRENIDQNLGIFVPKESHILVVRKRHNSKHNKSAFLVFWKVLSVKENQHSRVRLMGRGSEGVGAAV